jgi:hypothetical protein
MQRQIVFLFLLFPALAFGSENLFVCQEGEKIIVPISTGGSLFQCIKEVKADDLVQVGRQIVTNKDGAIVSISHHLDGLLDGDWIEFQTSGALKLRKFYRKGVECGVRIEFGINGNVLSTKKIRDCE